MSRQVFEQLKKRRKVTKVDTSVGTMHVRGINGIERDHWVQKYLDPNKPAQEKSLSDYELVALGVCTEDGTWLFEGQFGHVSADEAIDLAVRECMQLQSEDVLLLAREASKLAGLAVGTEDANIKK